MKIGVISIILMFSILAKGQHTNEIYLYFDKNNSELCEVPISQQGRYHGKKQVRRYEKIESSQNKNDRDRFYICNELFIPEKDSRIKKCKINYLKAIEFSHIDDLIEIVNKENPLYPSKVYPIIYLVEKINKREMLIHEVKWQYYTE